MRLLTALTNLSIIIGLIIGLTPSAFAQYRSPNYRVEEAFFGTGGEVDTSSGQYRANTSTGNLGVGTNTSNNYDVYSGFVTPSEPFLEMVVMSVNVDFGTLDPNSNANAAAQGGTCSCSFYVRTYLSSEYSVLTVSQPPTNEGGDVINAKTTLGVPSTDPDTEEFGINLVDNSSPDIGKNAANLPDNTFADGQAASGYSTPNQFKYGVGDVIARSQATAGRQAVGVTEYTISYLIKSNNLTPAGLYQMRHDLVVIATY